MSEQVAIVGIGYSGFSPLTPEVHNPLNDVLAQIACLTPRAF